jgi:hypothetical protein
LDLAVVLVQDIESVIGEGGRVQSQERDGRCRQTLREVDNDIRLSNQRSSLRSELACYLRCFLGCGGDESDTHYPMHVEVDDGTTRRPLNHHYVSLSGIRDAPCRQDVPRNLGEDVIERLSSVNPNETAGPEALCNIATSSLLEVVK